MTQPSNYPFHTIISTAPSFDSTLGASGLYVLQTTGRTWQTPSNRSLRVAAVGDYTIGFGSSDAAASILMFSREPEVFHLTASQTYVAFASSTDVQVNFTLGYGG